MLKIFATQYGTPETIWVICKVLASRGEMTREALADAVMPKTFVDRTDGKSIPNTSFDALLSLASKLRIIEQNRQKEEEHVRLLCGDDEIRELHRFRTTLRRALFSSNSLDEKDGRYPDVVNATAWLLASNPNRPLDVSWDGETDKRFTSAKARKDTVGNSTQMSQFKVWAVFLGIASIRAGVDGQEMLVADPRQALIDEIASLPKKRMEATAFADFLLANLPVLDGGPVLKQLDENGVATERGKHEMTFGEVSGRALHLLCEEGRLSMTSKADAKPQSRILVWQPTGVRGFDGVTPK